MRIFVLWVMASGCGASSTGRDGDGDIDADVDSDSDADGDTDSDTDSREPCPTDTDYPITTTCTTTADCEPSNCVIAGGVCVEEEWLCGDCGRCFYERVNHLDPPDGWECDEANVHCVPR
jgi:hypothetical protein